MSETTLSATHREVGFVEAIQLYLGNYVKFDGRSSRGAYWYAVLALFVIGVVTGVLDLIVFPSSPYSPLNSIVSLATILPSLALGIRRLHDIGKSGWWTLLAFLPIIGWLVLIFWAAQPGKREDLGKFGADVEAGKA